MAPRPTARPSAGAANASALFQVRELARVAAPAPRGAATPERAATPAADSGGTRPRAELAREHAPLVPVAPPPGGGRAGDHLVGELRDALTGAPLSGLLVVARIRLVAGADVDAPVPPAQAVGEARSDVRGRFALALDDDPRARAARALLGRGDLAELVLAVESASGEVYLESEPVELGAGEVTLRVPLPGDEPGPAVWKEVAERLETSGTLRIDEVAGELAGRPSPDSPFADWPVEKRQAVLASLERHFLDPEGTLARSVASPVFATRHALGADHELTRALEENPEDEPLHGAAVEALGRLASFDGLRSVDWLVDTNELRAGRPGPALSKHAVLAVDAVAGIAGSLKPVAPGSYGPRARYRDYLRAILCGSARTQGFQELHGRLADRLHQTFTSSDDTTRPANEVVIPILRAILTAPRHEGYGFGLASSQIEPQGDRSAREYLDHLVELSGVSAEELRRRYHVDFARPDGESSSRVRQNVDTLQSFLRDAFQAKADPYDPIVPDGPHDPRRRQPFFLYYEEWLEARRTFFPENHYPLKQTFGTAVTAAGREHVEGWAAQGNDWFLTMLAAEDVFREANELASKSSPGGAIDLYLQARTLALKALDEARSSEAAKKLTGKFSNNPLAVLVRPAIEQLAQRSADDPEGLDDLVRWLVPDLDKGWPSDPTPEENFPTWMDATFSRHLLSLLRLGLTIVPACLAEAAAEVGDFASAVAWYAQATRALTLLGELREEAGWPRHPSLNAAAGDSYYPRWHPYTGELPYGFTKDAVGEAEAGIPGAVHYDLTGWGMHAYQYQADVVPGVEAAYLRLRYAEALLGWADALYRTDEDASIQRARELYKAVLLLHGQRPPIDPTWPKRSRLQLGRLAAQALQVRSSTGSTYAEASTFQAGSRATLGRFAEVATRSLSLHPVGANGGLASIVSAGPATATSSAPASPGSSAVTASPVMGAAGLQALLAGIQAMPLYDSSVNPARRTQVDRARLGLYQIAAGLNAYGLREDLVPALRFRPLKEAADHFASSARAAQDDLLHYLGKVEDALKEQIVSAHVLRKATLQAAIADEQVALASYTEGLALQQVHAVQKQVDAKRQELADEKSFWGQVGSFFEGFVGAIRDLPDDLVGAGGSGAAAVAGYGSYEASGALASLGAGGAAMAGYGIVVYAGVSSMLAMEAELDSLVDQIHHLEGPVMHAAKGQHAAKQRETKIAQLQRSIAASEVALARDLIAFESQRFLNIELWDRLADLMKRILRRYLDLGTRYAWLAERALAYEQDRTLDVIRLDYMPRELSGITGADLLKRDLDELEAARLDGVRKALPITHTLSLAFDFPLQFQELQRTGRCTFRTSELPFRLGHPGTYGHRVLAVTGRLRTRSGTAPFRGMLTNAGHSLVSDRDGSQKLSIRPAEGQPLSEFRLRRDREVFGLPDETLYAFEGSGVDTSWTLELPDGGSPYGRRDLLDVELVLDVRARFSPALHRTDTASPRRAPRTLLLSARRLDPAALAGLAAGAPDATVAFDLAALGLPGAGQDVVRHAVLLVAAEGTVDGSATVDAQGAPVDVAVLRGVASSYPTEDDSPPGALTQLAGLGLDGTVAVTLEAARFPGVDLTTVRDVLLALEVHPA